MTAVKTEHISVGEEKPTSCFLAGIRFKLNVLILLYFLLTQRQYELMHLRFLHWTPVALKKSIFDLNRNMNITIWRKKKHYAWIVPWTSSQLFVPTLNEKSVPGLWIRQRPPFLSSLSSIAIVFTHWLWTTTKTKQKKEEKKTQTKFISGHFHDAGLYNSCDVNSLLNRTSKMGSKLRVS